jgi:hypothetical protein
MSSMVAITANGWGFMSVIFLPNLKNKRRKKLLHKCVVSSSSIRYSSFETKEKIIINLERWQITKN